MHVRKKRDDSRRTPIFLILSALCVILTGCNAIAKQQLPSPEKIGEHIRSLLELPAYEYVYRDIVYIADQASFLGIRHRDTQLLFAVDVHLRAGIDLQRGYTITPLSTGGIRIELPAPEILTVDADETSIHQYFKREIGGEINRLDYYDEISRSKENIREDALARGVLDQAQTNSRAVLQSILKQAGIAEVEISFRNGHPGEAAP